MSHLTRRAAAIFAPLVFFYLSILVPDRMHTQSASQAGVGVAKGETPVAPDHVTKVVTETIDPTETGADHRASRATRADHDPPPGVRPLSTENGPTVRAQSSGTYSVTFQGNWTTDSTPGGVVAGAHFTTLIGAIHNDMVTFWESGGTATAGVENVAELGSTGTFESEINANSNAVSVIEQSVSSGGTGSATLISRSPTHPPWSLCSR